MKEDGRIFASWYSGEIVAAQGGVIRDEAHLFFNRNHEKEIVLTIEDGKVVSKSKVYHNYIIGDDYHNWLQRLTPVIKSFPTEKYKLDRKRYHFRAELKKMNGKWEITMLNPKEDKNKRKLERELTKLINNQDNPNGGYWIHDQWVAPSRFMIPLLVKSNARDGKK